jgi:hypothetical protein
MAADDEWMYTTPQLKGRVFRDCAKPGVLSYGLSIIPLIFQHATRSLALTGTVPVFVLASWHRACSRVRIVLVLHRSRSTLRV